MADVISPLVGSLAGGGAPNPPNLQTYQPMYTGTADQGAFLYAQRLNANNAYAENQPAYAKLEQAGYNNPYAAGAQTAANAAGAQYGQLGTTGMQSSNALNAGAMQLLPYVSQVENTAMDPQNALYNRTKQQVMDQAGVSNAQNGLTGSPYGAGVQNAANSNFNIDWQNNKLNRQISGVGAAATGLGAAGNAMNTAQSVGTNAAGSTGLAGEVPNAAYLKNIGNALNALNQYGTSQTNANANTQIAQQDLQQYLNSGLNQSNAQAQLNQTSYNDQLAAANAQNSGITSLVNGGMNALFGAAPSGGSSNGLLSSGGMTAALMEMFA